MMPIYSVIVPHYNDVKRLARLLKSIPFDRSDLEVLVIDDCSPCQSELDAVRASWPKVSWLSTTVNGGAGVARNVGLNAATGDWLVFADSDDEFLPGAFENFDRALVGDYELIYFLAESVQEVDGSPSLSAVNLNSLVLTCSQELSEFNVQQLRFNHVVPWAKVYSHNFVKSIGVKFDCVNFGNDVAFNVLAAVQTSKLQAIPVPVYRYYRRPGSLMTDMTKDVFLQRFSQAISIADRLAQIGFNNVRPATGYMLRALRFGPLVAFNVWLRAIRSPMRIEWFRLIQPGRWVRFLSSQRAEAREYAQLKRDGGPSDSKDGGTI